jgi:hypothetical protein
VVLIGELIGIKPYRDGLDSWNSLFDSELTRVIPQNDVIHPLVAAESDWFPAGQDGDGIKRGNQAAINLHVIHLHCRIGRGRWRLAWMQKLRTRTPEHHRGKQHRGRGGQPTQPAQPTT